MQEGVLKISMNGDDSGSIRYSDENRCERNSRQKVIVDREATVGDTGHEFGFGSRKWVLGTKDGQ